MKEEEKLQSRRKHLVRRAVRILVKCVIGLALASITLVVLLRFVPPPVSALMIERRVDSARYNWVSLDKIAPEMAVAVIASEDQAFFEHYGFDWKAIEKAIDYNERNTRTRGASTVSQQTAKNLFLWSGRTWIRKAAEAYFTVLLETFWGKRRILETYLNIVEFGDGVYGVEAASQRYFRKPATRLNADEAALLAAVLPNPHRLKVSAPSPYVLERQQWIRQQMDRLGGTGIIKKIQ